jgi:hypothetical protein
MKEDVPWFVSLFVSIVPMLLYIWSIWWLGQQIRRGYTGA